MKTPSAPSATSSSGQVKASPILQSWPKLNSASDGAAAAAGEFFPAGGGFGFAGEGGNFQPGGIPFHARVFDGGQRAGEFDLEIFLRPGFVVDGLHLGERGAEIAERLDHLLGVAAGGELGLFQQAKAARELLDDFLAAGQEFRLPAAQFLQAGALAFQFLLRALEFDELLLRLDDLAVRVVARWARQTAICAP